MNHHGQLIAGADLEREFVQVLGKARQCGYRSARGAIPAYVDADTIMPAGWIEQVREEFARDAGLAYLSGPYGPHGKSL